MKSTINVPTVPLQEAIDRVARFRKQIQTAAQVPEENIPRAIFIPIADIMAIIDKFQTIDAEGNIHSAIRGVRAYFAVKEGDEDLPDDITALIVPVDVKGNDIIATNNGLKDDVDDSDIYDFTKPCPSYCDPNSPLFIQ
ncbi:hypothetical protein [Pedobacter sp. ASV28]|jgi:hypothetical protein|uniref:hypothetical protein n=1 Tax=Pedobacter sp. ASV28 TaxID=2795123 RepID=UPI0018ED1594|nr:hypothetical protein [Pedobacter sp. ASV28]